MLPSFLSRSISAVSRGCDRLSMYNRVAPVRCWKSAVLAASTTPRQVALTVPVGLASGPGVGGLGGAAPCVPIHINRQPSLANHHCRVAVLSPEAVASKGRVVSQGAGDRVGIVPGACIFRTVELPEIACGPGQLPRAGLGNGRFTRAGEFLVEVLIRHQGCARGKVWLAGGRDWLAGGKRGGAAATATAGGESQGASQRRDGRLQGGMVVLLAPPTTLADKRRAGCS